ncbi:MAG: hypothetical protein Q8Q15_00660 [bacterium]|nr:hypothetical protein [bacterium]
MNEPIFYVSPDLSRAIGLETELENYHIICLDDSQLVDLLMARGMKVFSLERALGRKNQVIRSTGEILAHPLVQTYIEKESLGERPNLLFFKPSKKIENVARQKSYFLLGNPSSLNEKFEDKISFYNLCREYDLPVPEGEIVSLPDARYVDLKEKYGPNFVFQFGHGWAGNTTYFVKDKEGFTNLLRNCPVVKARVTRFVKGETYLNNVCVTRDKIYISPSAIQITAPDGFTKNPGGTCGRQWPARLNTRSKNQIEEYSRKVGMMMREAGYRGFFGLDFLLEEETGKVYLSENNARLTASVPMFTKLQLKARQTPLLLRHILEFLGDEQPTDTENDDEISGSEIIIRNNTSTPVRVTKSFPAGIYTFKEKLHKVRDGYSLSDIESDDEFLMIAAEEGRIVTSENELARLDCPVSILDDQGIKSWAKKTLQEVKNLLNLVNNG